jgi:hypothetical protein
MNRFKTCITNRIRAPIMTIPELTGKSRAKETAKPLRLMTRPKTAPTPREQAAARYHFLEPATSQQAGGSRFFFFK